MCEKISEMIAEQVSINSYIGSELSKINIALLDAFKACAHDLVEDLVRGVRIDSIYENYNINWIPEFKFNANVFRMMVNYFGCAGSLLTLCEEAFSQQTVIDETEVVKIINDLDKNIDECFENMITMSELYEKGFEESRRKFCRGTKTN